MNVLPCYSDEDLERNLFAAISAANESEWAESFLAPEIALWEEVLKSRKERQEKMEKLTMSGPCYLTDEGDLVFWRKFKKETLDLHEVTRAFSVKKDTSLHTFSEGISKEYAEGISKTLAEKYEDVGLESLILTNDEVVTIQFAGPSYYVHQALVYVHGWQACYQDLFKKT